MKFSFYPWLLVLGFNFCFFTAFSQNIFMAVTSTPAIKGESIYAGHIDQIDITDLSQGNESCANFPPSGGPPNLCKPTIGQVKFNMVLNTSAIGFRNQMFSGKAMNKVDVFFEKSGVDNKPVTYQKIRMEEVFVVGVEEVADSDGRPTVQVILQARRIGWVYYKNDINGNPSKTPEKTGWDVSTVQPWTPAD
jgi:type VI protein secretion system component Hcp